VRIVRAQALGQDVLNSGGLNNGTNSTPGDDARTIGSWFQDNVAGAKSSGHLKRDSSCHKWNPDQIFFCLFQSLANRFRHFVGLAHSATDHGMIVADDNQGAKAEPAATFDHFGHPANMNNFFLEF
jgi:hypothetical protein